MSVYGAAPESSKPRTKVRTHHLQQWKSEGHKWAMLTAYDYSTARVFDDAGIPVLLVGDSAANVVYGYDTTVPITVDELIPLVRGVVRGAEHALVVADLPFGSYEESPRQALATATRFIVTTASMPRTSSAWAICGNATATMVRSRLTARVPAVIAPNAIHVERLT